MLRLPVYMSNIFFFARSSLFFRLTRTLAVEMKRAVHFLLVGSSLFDFAQTVVVTRNI